MKTDNNNNNLVAEWRPAETFNLLDFRDFKSFPQQKVHPYVLSFRFSHLKGSLEMTAVNLRLMGWNLPECQTNRLFSKIQVSKNGFEDIYYSRPGGLTGDNNMTLPFDKKMVLRSSQDVLAITLFPLCPVHMVDVEAVLFLSDTTGGTMTMTTGAPIERMENNNNNKQDPLERLTNPQPLDHNWYIYATIFVMVLLLLISMLFAAINQPKKTPRHIVVIRPQK